MSNNPLNNASEKTTPVLNRKHVIVFVLSLPIFFTVLAFIGFLVFQTSIKWSTATTAENKLELGLMLVLIILLETIIVILLNKITRWALGRFIIKTSEKSGKE